MDSANFSKIYGANSLVIRYPEHVCALMARTNPPLKFSVKSAVLLANKKQSNLLPNELIKSIILNFDLNSMSSSILFDNHTDCF